MRSILRAAVAAGASLALAGIASGCAAAPGTAPVAAVKPAAPAAVSSTRTTPSTTTASSRSAAPTTATRSAKAVTHSAKAAVVAPARIAGDPCSAAASACVSISRQEAWFVRDGKVVLGPVRVATGRPGYGTQIGTFRVYSKQRMHYSTIYNNAPMPWSVFFDGGEAFHEDPVTVRSHGCVHLTAKNAQWVFNFLQIGNEVQVVY